MELGAISISLNVKDLEVSKSFYEKLGFQIFGGEITQNWLIMKNGDHTIGLLQGMFEKNILTFNPGWDQNCNTIDTFTDFRDLQKKLKSRGLNIDPEVDETMTGPASFTVIDPDGNPIMIDQHV